jgi:hypothetical protein
MAALCGETQCGGSISPLGVSWAVAIRRESARSGE